MNLEVAKKKWHHYHGPIYYASGGLCLYIALGLGW